MAVDQDNVSRVLSVLSHPLRRGILENLSEKNELSFTDLMNALSIDTGKLSFHIRSLSGFVEQTSAGKYKLTSVGVNGVRLLKELETWVVEADVATKKPDAIPVAGLAKRVYAFLIDFGITFSIFIVAGLATNLFSFLTGGGSFRLDANLIVYLVLFWIYLTLLEGFAGQTLGKRVVGLRVVRVDGKKLSYDYAAVRNFGTAFLPLLPFDLLFGYRLKDRRFARYFDKFAGTMVLDLRP